MTIKHYEPYISAVVVLLLIALFIFAALQLPAPTNELVDQPISQSERATIMLHICYPNGIYRADAAPGCPQFETWLVKQLNKGEK